MEKRGESSHLILMFTKLEKHDAAVTNTVQIMLVKIFSRNSMPIASHTANSRKVVGKNVHATIPKGNMGYDRYTVPDDCSCRTYFCCFPLALTNTFSWAFVPILSNFVEGQ